MVKLLFVSFAIRDLQIIEASHSFVQGLVCVKQILCVDLAVQNRNENMGQEIEKKKYKKTQPRT